MIPLRERRMVLALSVTLVYTLPHLGLVCYAAAGSPQQSLTQMLMLVSLATDDSGFL